MLAGLGGVLGNENTEGLSQRDFRGYTKGIGWILAKNSLCFKQSYL